MFGDSSALAINSANPPLLLHLKRDQNVLGEYRFTISVLKLRCKPDQQIEKRGHEDGANCFIH